MIKISNFVSTLRTCAGTGTTMIALGFLASTAQAIDGVAEINQTCAANTGCFAGDAPGLPVQITEGGSYRLTGNLTLSGAGSPTSMISINASNVTLDLNGFSVRCSGAGGGSCSGSTSGITGTANRVTVRNGFIADMPGDGIDLQGSNLRGLGIQALNNGGDGIALGTATTLMGGGVYSGMLVESSVASGNGGNGIAVGRASLIRGCVSLGNGGNGISGTSTLQGLFLNTQSGYVETVVQLNAGFAATIIVDMGSNLCDDCP